MAIVVEDGTVVEGANSYISVQDLKDYASLRNISLPADDLLPGALILAMDYLGKYDAQWPGSPLGGLAWPRKDVDWSGVPAGIVKAQLILSVKSAQGTPLFADTTSESPVLKREKIDVLEFEYAVSEVDPTRATQPSFPEVDAAIAPYLTENGWYGRTQVRRS